MKDTERELLIRIDERVEVNSNVLKHLHDKMDKLSNDYVKKNEIKHILTAYYLVSRTVIVALASGTLYMIVYHAKIIDKIF